MKFKSIQFSVAALAGAIVLSIVAALVLYAVYSGAKTQELVETRTQQQFDAVIEQRLTALAQGNQLRLSPAATGTDGFFIALFERAS